MGCMPVGMIAEIEQEYTPMRIQRLRHYLTMARQLMEHHRSYGVACMTLEQALDSMLESVEDAEKSALVRAYDGPDESDEDTPTSIAAFALIEVLAWERGEGHHITSCSCELQFICEHEGAP